MLIHTTVFYLTSGFLERTPELKSGKLYVLCHVGRQKERKATVSGSNLSRTGSVKGTPFIPLKTAPTSSVPRNSLIQYIFEDWRAYTETNDNFNMTRLMLRVT
jgi:hypothetical protein